MVARIRYLGLFILLAGLLLPPLAAGYQPWSENVYHYVKEKYGDQAEKRIRFLNKLIHENQNAPVAKKLQLVNNTLNHLPWIADQKHWKSSDYWATPMETITTFGGDCEDIASAKWLMLRYLGIPKENLALAYVRIKKTFEAHIVLLYFPDPDIPASKRDPLVLDNYVRTIQKGSERNDLWAIYSIDTKGTIVLYTDNGTDRGIKGVFENKKNRKLEDLKKRVRQDMLFFKELNDGKHPLL